MAKAFAVLLRLTSLIPKRKDLLLAAFLSASIPLFAQFNIDEAQDEDNYYDDSFIRLENFIYYPNVRTVMLHPKGWPLSPPFIQLDDPESFLELHFDILDSSLGNFMYSLIHCDHDWQQSELDPQEYINGPPEDFLNEYDYSRNTYQKYIHYTLQIPNFNMRITRSGNYVLKVFDSDTKALVLTRRFCVTEDILNVDVKVKQATMVKQRYSHQEIDFTIASNGYDLTNPYQDLHVVILQNHSWANPLTGLDPRFVKQNVLDYDYDGPNAMEGGNEFRILDIKNTRFTGMGVEKVTYGGGENHAYLEADKSRLSQAYLQNRDINGWFFIQNDLFGGEGHVSADYVTAHFSLRQQQALRDGDVYVYGALTDWKIKQEAKMTFNQVALQYESSLYIKQGIYNYIYAFVKDGQIEPDFTRFEGSHFQTENEYSVLVYHRQLGWDYDRLLRITTVTFPQRD